jgi:lysine 2,3-aminomutase
MSVKLYTNHLERRHTYFPNITDEQWNDWHWQVKNRIKSVDDLRKFMLFSDEEETQIAQVLSTFRMAITPYYFT